LQILRPAVGVREPGKALNIGCQAIYATGNAERRMKIDLEIRMPRKVEHKASFSGLETVSAGPTKAAQVVSMNHC
jgi:hypothetical protein